MEWIKKHKILTVVLALVVIGVVSSASGNVADNTTSSNTGSSNTEPKKQEEKKPVAMAKVGEAARDGKFEFTVKSIECGKDTVGANEYLQKKAQGQFCLLNVTVKNIGDKPQGLFSTNQKLFNGQGQEYAADDTATMYAAPDMGSTWYSNINPGNSVEGAIVFDLPKDVTPTRAELHDSAASGGVEVSLQ